MQIPFVIGVCISLRKAICQALYNDKRWWLQILEWRFITTLKLRESLLLVIIYVGKQSQCTECRLIERDLSDLFLLKMVRSSHCKLACVWTTVAQLVRKQRLTYTKKVKRLFLGYIYLNIHNDFYPFLFSKEKPMYRNEAYSYFKHIVFFKSFLKYSNGMLIFIPWANGMYC